MKNKPASRGVDIYNDICVDKIGNRFNLVLIAAARAREISKKNKDENNLTYISPGVTALLEIQNGKVGKEYLRKVK